ncbi:MAG: copper amine oxidase N-terminal domain-containing protein, partial [Clostridia bacterium]|nr:copper amine oxidase N-terminal domain-containing protein [Clostridia bacterium]
STVGIDSGVAVTLEKNVINDVAFTTWLAPSAEEADYTTVTVENNTLSESALETFQETISEDVVSVPQIAEVNGKAETLLSAPELTANGFTMVPLRFISENFGALVSYEDATRKITVTKENAQTGNMVEGAVTAVNIGDRFYGWSMENPTNMQMVEREFDGTYTEFAYDEDNDLALSIKATPDDYDFERDFTQWKNDLSGLTLVKADKSSANAYPKTMHFQAKNKTDFLDIRVFMTEEYGYLLTGVCTNSNTQRKNDMLSIMDTFALSYQAGDIHDLSNAKNGVRTYTSEDMKFSIDIPDSYFEVSSEDVQNTFRFANPHEDVLNSTIFVGIYSKSQVGSAKELAEKDYAHNEKTLNTNFATLKKVSAKQYAGFSGYEYTVKTNGTVQKSHMRDVFFEVGDYVYNVSVSVQLPDSSADKKLDAVLNSVVANELDADEIGLLMRNIPDEEGTYTLKEGNWSMIVPNSYEELAASATQTVLQSRLTGVVVSLSTTAAVGSNFSDVRSSMLDMEESVKSDGGEIVSKTTRKYMGSMQVAAMTYSQQEEGGNVYYYTQYAGIEGGTLVLFVIQYPELGYSVSNIEEADNIVKSFQMK